MADIIDLADLIASYPPLDAPQFQYRISAKEEFASLASSSQETPPRAQGQFYRHQERLRRYMSEYSEVLLIDEPGTGKSCSVASFTEYADRQRQLLADGKPSDTKNNHFRRTIMVTAGKVQTEAFRTELYCRCSVVGKYVTPHVLAATSSLAQRRALTAELNKWYSLMNYGKLWKAISKTVEGARTVEEREDRLRTQYDHTIFWFDEVHTLLSSSRTISNETEKAQIYNSILDLFSVVRHVKRFLSTATPMLNDASDIEPIMNIILPNDMQMQFGASIHSATLEQLAPYFIGRVNFVRALDTHVDVENIGELIESEHQLPTGPMESTLVLKAMTMSNLQMLSIARLRQNSSQGANIYTDDRQIATFVFPDGSWGGDVKRDATSTVDLSKGFGKYVKGDGSDFSAKKIFSDYLNAPTPDEQLRRIDNLSPKFGDLIRLIEEYPTRTHYVYFEYIEAAAVPFMLCLEARGFKRFNERSSIFTSPNRNKPASPCATDNGTARQLREEFRQPRKRYMFISGDRASASRLNYFLDAMNSVENIEGAICQIFISTSVGREGISLANVSYTNIMGPEFNPSVIYQASRRTIRSTSHEALLNRLRANLIDQYLMADLSYDAAVERAQVEARLPVYMTRYAAVEQGGNANRSTDIQIYLSAERKDMGNHRILRMMKQCAVNCQIDYARNVRSNDVAGSTDCDYQDCNYLCLDDPPPLERDYSTYDVLYLDSLINNTAPLVESLFQSYNGITLAEMRQLLLSLYARQARVRELLIVVEYLISSKIPLLDKYGYTCYLREDRGLFYTDRTYPVQGSANYLDAVYSQTVVGIVEAGLAGIMIQQEKAYISSQLPALRLADVESVEFLQGVLNLSLEGQAELVEEATLEAVTKAPTAFTDKLLDYFHLLLFALNEPITLLRNAVRRAASGTGRRRTTAKTKSRVEKLKLETVADVEQLRNELGLGSVDGISPDLNTEVVYVHALYVQSGDSQNHARVSRYYNMEGRLRILKPSEQPLGWRDMTDVELGVYNTLLQLLKAEEVLEARQLTVNGYHIYGIVLPTDGIMHIADVENEPAPGTATSTRQKKRGQQCDSFSKGQLANLLWVLQVPLEAIVTGGTTGARRARTVTLETMTHDLTKLYKSQDPLSWDAERIRYIYYASAPGKRHLCSILTAALDEAGVVIR
jgi:hypothetical protein